MEIRPGHISIPIGTGERTISHPVSFTRRVNPDKVWVALSGYDARYTSEDHHVRQLKVMLSTHPREFDVDVIVNFNLRDRNADDEFTGSVDFLLFVELDQHPRPSNL